MLGDTQRMKQHYHYKVFGLVQGVSFRVCAKHKAQSLGLTGFVKNLPDKTVYIEAEGDEESLQLFERWCWRGAPASVVEHVETWEGIWEDFEVIDLM